MIKRFVIFLCFFLFLTGEGFSITATGKKYGANTIRIGAIVKTQEGKYLETDESRELEKKIAAYTQEKLEEKGLAVKVVLDDYFPPECGFFGTIQEQYRPYPLDPREKTLRLYAVIEGEAGVAPNEYPLLTCPEALDTRGWPGRDKQGDYKDQCTTIDPRLRVERSFCEAKYKLDAIIWMIIEAEKVRDSN